MTYRKGLEEPIILIKGNPIKAQKNLHCKKVNAYEDQEEDELVKQ